MENNQFNNPNLFMHNLMGNLGSLTKELQKASDKVNSMGVDKQYQFSYKAKDGTVKPGILIVFKPSKSISIDIKGITDDEIKEILTMLNDKR